MTELTRENFDQKLAEHNKALIFFHRPNHAASFLGHTLIKAIDQMVGKDFEIFSVNISNEPEVCDLFSISDVPEYVCVKNKKIHKRAVQLKYTNQVLNLLK